MSGVLKLSQTCHHWHYKSWQKTLGGYMKTFAKNRQPNNNMIGYVTNDKHPKSIRVQCERWLYSVRYQKSFRISKKVWAHDENCDSHLGDIVKVQPMGQRIGPWKRYVLVEVLYREPHDYMTDLSKDDDELSDLEDEEPELARREHRSVDYFKTPETTGWLSQTVSRETPSDHVAMPYRQRDCTPEIRRGRKWLPFLDRR